MGFMGKATVHPSSLDLGGDGAVTQTFIYNYHKGGQEQIPLWQSGVKTFHAS